ncbi:hypothetical protein PCCS19_23800 [Paenibacillus sp. CCS19]|uniref:hypothetical protein n=1 Tax=Paenibacillus sp. CCS19 TaxID=3158387 RepID=UPI00255EFB22|nr:hypothetical protein [Paenibacillus cellulosilyticus]GMK39326.1 hypothetical protein PCCS19_23800 [Paenibacillus cellulosilyticus]
MYTVQAGTFVLNLEIVIYLFAGNDDRGETVGCRWLREYGLTFPVVRDEAGLSNGNTKLPPIRPHT